MKTVTELKEELKLNGSLTELMDVLKDIGASEFRAMTRRLGRFARFTEAFEGFFRMVDLSGSAHPFTQDSGALAIMIVTSNEGFMGGLNMRVINDALAYPGADQARLIMIGEQGAGVLSSYGRSFKGFPGIPGGECYEMAVRLKEYVTTAARDGTFGRLMVFYPKPVSFMVQKVDILRLLPCTKVFEEQLQGKTEEREVIVESQIDGIVEYLVEMWIIQKLFEAFEDSKLAEFSARTVRLEESYQTLLEQGKGLRYQYHRARHEMIDNELRDVFSAQIARKKARGIR